jgi:hypothetical protein
MRKRAAEVNSSAKKMTCAGSSAQVMFYSFRVLSLHDPLRANVLVENVVLSRDNFRRL